MHYAMVIDTGKCIGCKACAVACKSNNNLPDGMWWNRVDMSDGQELETATGSYPDSLSLGFVPVACQHCDAPPCVAVCPAAATYKLDDGTVTIDAELCIGCKLCIDACPYKVRAFNDAAPVYQTEFPLGDSDAPAHIEMKVEKCDFCAHRLARGAEPACMELCLGRCRFWGDIDDPGSEVSKYIVGKETYRLLEDEKTAPSTIYVR